MAAGAALCLVLCLSGCGWRETLDSLFRAVSPVQPVSESNSTVAPDTAALPGDAKSVEGLVLDASDGMLILRAVEGGEYVFRMEDAQDLVEGGTAAGQFVRLWYHGAIEGTNARNVKVLRVEAAQETQPDTYDRNCIAEGCVVSFNEWRITIRTVGGEEYIFMAGENTRAMQELAEGMWVRVYFDGTPDSAVVSRVTESVNAADVFTVVGVLRGMDETAGTLTLRADGGGTYTFDAGGVEMIAPDGIWADERRFVLSYRGSASPQDTGYAVLLRMCAEKAAGEQVVQGVVCDVNENRGTLDMCTADGRVLTFSTGKTILKNENGVRPGDGVTITYTGCISGTSMHDVEVISLSLRSGGGTVESSVLGEVFRVTDHLLTLKAADGRTLQFPLPEGKYFPERMAQGDTVYVTYTGWIPGEDTSCAAYVTAARAYT